MANHILANRSFRWAMISATYMFTIIHAYLLILWFKIADTIAWTDSIIHIVSLALICVAVCLSLSHYRPVKGKIAFLLIYCSVLTFMWTGCCYWLINELFQVPYYQHFTYFAIPVRFILGWLIVTGIGVKTLSWYDMEDKQQELARKEETERMAREAELFKLRQQLQPHFLFNSLNSINALIALRPQQAREMVLKLSDFLRGTLKREDQQWILLPEEIQYLQLYLDIEKVRFGHRLSTDTTMEDSAKSMKMPPMLLQPVVENAIKFGLYDTTDAITIAISAWESDDMLHIQVQNPFDPEMQAPAGTGFGLTSIHRRLYLLFGRQDLLETNANGNIFTTLIKVPQLYDKSSNN
ncbi:sensor histidine kinase [Chitinophaga rhizophila]|uniref:Histidine kinase n=1 Tax=Chitinophaga rhizophila TaxID=2866212 RepID=A0ABS7GBV0_9BACT|nr:histidine kinase [Chitinophaga rhizophila]MBW8685151.1 histidine kinase [Chitinophaga rhizophila]